MEKRTKLYLYEGTDVHDLQQIEKINKDIELLLKDGYIIKTVTKITTIELIRK